jgi:CcmD family protein
MTMRVALMVALLFTTPLLAPAFAAGFGVAEQQPQPQPAPAQPVDEYVPVSQLPAQDQLPAAPLLVTAYAFVWVALFGYLVSVGRRLSKVQREVERLESDIAKGSRA